MVRCPVLFRLFVAAAFLLTSAGCGRSGPSDDELITNLQTHQSKFQELLQMFLADEGLTRVDFTFTRPENPESIGITQQRLDEYRQVFVDLKLLNGIGAHWKNGKEVKDIVWFFASATAGRRGSSQKHYLYMNTAPVVTIDNLDDPSSKRRPYRHIQGNWYLFLEDLD